MDDRLVPRFDVWLPAVETGLLPLASLVAWADGEIVRLAEPPLWLLDLSLATDLAGVERAAEVVPEAEREGSGVNRGVMYLGMLYLAHEAGRVTMAKLLREAGEYADGMGGWGGVPDCEAFYYLLNEIDGGGPVGRSERPLAERVRELFTPMAEVARGAMEEVRRVGGG